MEKILFPTDFSDYSPQLLRYALALAESFDATLVPMHVYGDGDTAALPKKEQDGLADQMADVLTDFIVKNKVKEFEGVKIEYIVDVGMPGKEIVDVALNEDIGLIVMGMTGKSNVIENIFGSTALAVIGKADCPVLAIPSSFKYSKPESIVYMTDFAFRDIGVLQNLRQWTSALDANIHCLHVIEKNQNELDAAINMSMLKEVFDSPAIHNFELMKGDLVEITNKYLHEKNIGIVAMLSRKRDFLQRLLEGSQTRKVAKKLDRPILVFKENAYKPLKYPVDFSKFSIA